MSIVADKRFYVYVLARPSGVPFYVGKGSGARVFRHEEYARAGMRGHRYNIIRKIWRTGGQVQKYIVLETDNEQEALEYEQTLIAMYGREVLVNKTDGGEGTVNPAEPARAAVRVSNSRRYTKDGTRAAFIARMKLPEVKAKAKATRSDPVWRAQHAARVKAALDNPTTRALKSANAKRQFATTDAKARLDAARDWEHEKEILLERTKKLWADPEYKKKMSEKAKAQWADPEYKERMRARASDPEIRARAVATRVQRLAERKANDPNYQPTTKHLMTPEVRAKAEATKARNLEMKLRASREKLD